jgi:hypothetical protein
VIILNYYIKIPRKTLDKSIAILRKGIQLVALCRGSFRVKLEMMASSLLVSPILKSFSIIVPSSSRKSSMVEILLIVIAVHA